MNTYLDPAKRPGRPKSQEKNAAIRRAAADLFLNVGWAGTSMDAVARQAGVSKQTVYSHFKCKEELFSACITSKVALYQLDSAELEGRSLAEALSEYGRRVLELHNDPQVTQVYRLLVSHCLDFPHLISEFKAAGPERVEATVSRLLQQGNPQRFNDSNAHASALGFLKSLEAPYLLDLMWNVRQKISETEISQHVDRCVEQLLNAS